MVGVATDLWKLLLSTIIKTQNQIIAINTILPYNKYPAPTGAHFLKILPFPFFFLQKDQLFNIK